MNYKKKIILWCAVLLCLTNASGQHSTLVHLDKPFYVSGETMWYNLFLPAVNAEKSVTLKATLLSPDLSVIAAHYAASAKSPMCHGYFDLPLSAPSGIYQIVFSVVNADYQIKVLSEIAVPVYNDLKPPPLTSQETGVNKMELPGNEFSISIKEKAGQHEGADKFRVFEILITDAKGKPVAASGSVSVTDEQLTDKTGISVRNIFEDGNMSGCNTCWSGIIRTGRITDIKNNPVNIPLLAAYDGADDQLFFTKSNNEGFFSLEIPDFQGEKKIQITDQNGSDIVVNWNEPSFSHAEEKLQVTPGILDYLDLSRKRKMIDQIFPVEQAKTKKSGGKDLKNDWPTRRFFKVQDYQIFSDMATFFNEVSQIVRFMPSNGSYNIRLYDAEQDREFETRPMFIIDNQITFDIAFVEALSPALVDEVEILYGTQRLKKKYPALGSGGVIRIKTLQGAQQLPSAWQQDIFTVEGYAPDKKISGRPTDPQHPWFSPVLTWIPDLTTDNKGEAIIRVPVSDDLSIFSIQVVMQSKDGKRGQGSYRFSTKG